MMARRSKTGSPRQTSPEKHRTSAVDTLSIYSNIRFYCQLFTKQSCFELSQTECIFRRQIKYSLPGILLKVPNYSPFFFFLIKSDSNDGIVFERGENIVKKRIKY